jgi:preprotein translocase subunit SecY
MCNVMCVLFREKVSNRVAWVTAIVAAVMAVVTWIYDHKWKHASYTQAVGEGIWSAIIFVFVSFMETPFCAIGPLSKVKTTCLDTLQLKRPLVMGVIYVLASILTFIFPTPVIGTGLMLLITAIFKFCAQCQVSQDAADRASLSRPITTSV